MPQDKTTPISVIHPIQRVMPGTSTDAKNANTLGLNVHYFFTDNWAIEGVLGILPTIRGRHAGNGEPFGQGTPVRPGDIGQIFL